MRDKIWIVTWFATDGSLDRMERMAFDDAEAALGWYAEKTKLATVAPWAPVSIEELEVHHAA